MNVEELISKLSIEEKLSLLVGVGFFDVPKSVPGAAGETRAVSRLGIPSIILSDGPAGIRIFAVRLGEDRLYLTTAFPNEILLSSTWNTEVVEEVGKAIGEEAREYGVDVVLAPGLNIHRIPLGGRNFEYFSEDPLLSGEMAAAYVRGVQSAGVGATLKHFVANEQETNRTRIDVVVSERALREIYLRAFEIAIKKSDPWAVMAAYNKLLGKYCVQNKWLLTDVLRRDWGYKGLVMTDWLAGDNPVEQIKAGIDLIMPGDDKTLQLLIDSYRNGQIDEETINTRVRNVLNLIAKTPKARGYKPSGKPDLDKHREVAYRAAVEGFVLLKNNGALPIKPSAKVALFGKGSYRTAKGGLGSGTTYPLSIVSIASGLKEAGVSIDEEVEKVYNNILPMVFGSLDPSQFIRAMRVDVLKDKKADMISLLLFELMENAIDALEYMQVAEDVFSEEFLDRVAERNDVAVITISRTATEGRDRNPVKGDYYLRDDELNLICKVSEAFHRRNKKVVVLLNIPGPIDVVSWRDLVDAILVVWMPGQEAGRAVADVLVGKVSPSGKLPFTWPKDLYETPAMRTFPGEPRNDPIRVVYEEGIYIGYRYYDSFGLEPAYEFGYGLSYTDFEYRDLNISFEGEAVKVRFKVKNVGGYPGKEVAQIYVRAPRGKLDKPFQELKGFKKTRLLNPGEEEDIEIVIPITYLASFNGFKWVVEKGVYEIRVGTSSRKIKLVGSIEIEKDVCFDVKWEKIGCG
ncbi:MAG: beta-glucosidase [Ignisphaera sp.]